MLQIKLRRTFLYVFYGNTVIILEYLGAEWLYHMAVSTPFYIPTSRKCGASQLLLILTCGILGMVSCLNLDILLGM